VYPRPGCSRKLLPLRLPRSPSSLISDRLTAGQLALNQPIVVRIHVRERISKNEKPAEKIFSRNGATR
jgi:hypothetical protein